jgi:hypothetical protein
MESFVAKNEEGEEVKEEEEEVEGNSSTLSFRSS